MSKIALIGNAPHTLIGFRLDLIKELVNKGHKVYAFSPDYTEEHKEIVLKSGAIPVSFTMSRNGLNPLNELSIIWELRKLLIHYQVDVTLSYFIKPVIYGSIAAKTAGIKNINSMIAGLGYAFTKDQDDKLNVKRGLVRLFLTILFKVSLSFSTKVFFQNPDDKNEFIERNLVNPDKTIRVFGSGVNLNSFKNTEPITEPITFITVGRLLEEKGFREYYEASKMIKGKYPETRFILLGGSDDNPSALSESEVERWVEEGIIEWPGNVNNVEKWLQNSSVFVLPSYREGTPRSTLEAMATERAVITTDVPGCRETVNEGVNGYLVPPANPVALAGAMERFLQDTSLIFEMGRQSRRIAEDLYDVKKVNHFMISEMGLVQNQNGYSVHALNKVLQT